MREAIEKIKLTDVTFLIPVSYDHPDRKENLDMTFAFLHKHFETNFIIGEQGGSYFDYMSDHCFYTQFSMKEFHRTKMLNDMAHVSGTPIVVNWDADVVIEPKQILAAIEKIRSGVDFCYPYDGRFVMLPRAKWLPLFQHYWDVNIFQGVAPEPWESFGGAVVMNKERFFEAGGENEGFIAYTPEDVERMKRWIKLGYRVERIPGFLFHMNHFRGPNSSKENPHFHQGNLELAKVNSLNKEQLRSYIDSWPWRKINLAI